MKLDISRSSPVDGKTKARFEFDGIPAGELVIEWKAWQLWLKVLLAGANARQRDGVPTEINVSGFVEGTISVPEPPPQTRLEPVKAQKPPKVQAVPKVAKEYDESDLVADSLLGQPPTVKGG